MNRLDDAVAASPLLGRLLDGLTALGLPDAWLVAGVIAQTVWNQATGRPERHGISDVDIAFFDPGRLDADVELAAEARASRLFGDLGLRFDIKNQARVHLWYPARFGRVIAPHPSVAAAVATYPTTATAIAVRRQDARMEIVAPFGLDDLFALVVRPNRRLVDAAVYRAKASRWQARWPELTVLPWDPPPASPPASRARAGTPAATRP